MMKLKIEFLKLFVLEFSFAWLRDKIAAEEVDHEQDSPSAPVDDLQQ